MTTYKSRLGKKLWADFERFLESDFFSKQCLILRSKYGVPLFGFDLEETDIKLLQTDGGMFFVPAQAKGQSNLLRELNTELRELLSDFFVCAPHILVLTRLYLLYNQIPPQALSFFHSQFESENACEIVDLALEIADLGLLPIKNNSDDKVHVDEEIDSFLAAMYVSIMRRRVIDYPIAILLSPRRSQREIIDYIKSNWKEIDAQQIKYVKQSRPFQRTKVSKTSIRDRDRFIYANRSKSKKNIIKLMRKNGMVPLDEGHIGSIIRKEDKRRKKL